MVYVAKKISTIPFGAELPPDLVAAFDTVVDGEGWTKKRALAAAVRAFIKANAVDRHQYYRNAYREIDQLHDSDGGEHDRAMAEAREALRPPADRRRKTKGAG